MLHCNTRLVTILAGALLLPSWGAAAPLKKPKMDRALAQVIEDPSGEPISVIIRMKPGRRASVRDSLRARGDTIGQEFRSINALFALVKPSELAALAEDDSVESISSDAPVGAHSPHGGVAPGAYKRAFRETLGLTDVPWTGAGVGVAIIDSGIKGSIDFEGRLDSFEFRTTFNAIGSAMFGVTTVASTARR